MFMCLVDQDLSSKLFEGIMKKQMHGLMSTKQGRKAGRLFQASHLRQRAMYDVGHISACMSFSIREYSSVVYYLFVVFEHNRSISDQVVIVEGTLM